MSEINNNLDLETDLAQAAEPGEFEGEQVEAPNDPARSLGQGLARLYENYTSQIKKQLADSLIDEAKANELTDRVDSLSLAELGYEVSKGTSIERAKEIMGSNSFFGPNEVKKAGIEIKEEIPLVPFTSEELERAKELGHMLIYRTSTTMKELNDTIDPIFETRNKQKILSGSYPYKEEAFYVSDRIQPGWTLVSKKRISGSPNKNYLEQSELLAEYLVNEVFKGKPLPLKYQEAIDQLNDQKEIIRQLINMGDDGYPEASQMLANLEINKLTRQSPAEILYDRVVYLQNTGEELYFGFIRTSAKGRDNNLIFMGNILNSSTYVGGSMPNDRSSSCGAAFCQRGADLKS